MFNFLNRKPYQIRVCGHSVFVKWTKPIQQWTPEDGVDYLPSLWKAIKKTVDSETWQLISDPKFYDNPKYRSYVEGIRVRLIDEYHLQPKAETVKIGSYHMGLLVLSFPSACDTEYPYYYCGVQLKPFKEAQPSTPPNHHSPSAHAAGGC